MYYSKLIIVGERVAWDVNIYSERHTNFDEYGAAAPLEYGPFSTKIHSRHPIL